MGTGGALTNVSSLTVGFGTGTETGNQLVVNGSITATTVTVSDGNTLSGTGTDQRSGDLQYRSHSHLYPGLPDDHHRRDDL